MEEKNDFDKLLVSFLLKELNAEEEAFVAGKLKSDADLLRYYKELENLFRLLDIKQNMDGINLVQERKYFDQIYLKKQQEDVSGNEAQVYDIREYEEGNRSKSYKFFRAIAVAVSVLLVIGLGWRLYNNEVKKSTLVNDTTSVGNDKNLFTHNEVNVSGETRRFFLNDGTEVTLWNQSMVKFKDTFSATRRDIILKGKAGFKVTKDKKRPFTVYSGDISTTALGTEFVVANHEKDQNIIVRLLEGKVVVNSVESARIKLKKPIYLLPGQELLYNKGSALTVVRNFQQNSLKSETVAKDNQVHDDPSVPKNNAGSWYMFNNQSLPQVFDHLEKMFGVAIEYDRKDMQKLYFIGKFDKKDSLEYILRNITAINNLTLKKQKNKFLIHK